MSGQAQFHRARLGNGLTVIAEIMPRASSVAAGVFVRVGSRDEDPGVCGVSHFLEHMVFRGSRDCSSEAIQREFDSMQARYTAFTSEEYTAYYAATSPENQSRLLRLWIGLMEPALRTEDVEEERHAVLDELEDRINDPCLNVVDRAKQLHFGEHGCGRNALGTLESISRLDGRCVLEHHEKWYVPANMILACVGRIDWDALVEQAEALCARWKAVGEPARDTAEFRGTGLVKYILKKRMSREHVCIVAAAPSAQNAASHVAYVLADIVGGGRGSRLHAALVDCQLADRAESKYDALDGTGACYAYICCHPRYTAGVLETVRVCLEKVRTHGVSERELQASKKKLSFQMKRRDGMPRNRIAPAALGWLYRRRYFAIEDELETVQAISREDIRQLLEEYPLDRLTVSALGPFEGPLS